MGSVSEAFIALEGYISANKTSSTISILNLSDINNDIQIKRIYEFFNEDSSSISYKQFYESTFINLFSTHYYTQGIQREITFRTNESPRLLLQWISIKFGHIYGDSHGNGRVSRQKRRPSRFDEYTQERNRHRRRILSPPPQQSPPTLSPPTPSPPTISPPSPSSLTTTNATNMSSNSLYPIMDSFVKKLYEEKYIFCVSCSERKRFKPDLNSHCLQCRKDLNGEHHIASFGKDNDMDPFYHLDPRAMSELHSLEEECVLSDIEQVSLLRILT